MKLVVPGALPIYLALLLASIAAAAIVTIVHRRSIGLLSRRYWSFLLEPWRVLTFFAATAVITAAAPYSGDPTWDVPDSLLISALTFVLAPWSVAVLVRAVRQRLQRRREVPSAAETFVALVGFLVPCWTYDLYILLRDSYYPDAWAPNLVLSGLTCLLAGMFWNLAEGAERRPVLAFHLEQWPPSGKTSVRTILVPAAMVALPVLIMVAAFVLESLRQIHG